MPVSAPLCVPPDLPLAFGPVPSEKGGGTPGNRALDVSDVVVDERSTVELVASCRVVVVELVLVALAVVVDVFTVAVVDDGAGVVVLVAATTTTTPVIPCEAWILQW